MNKKILGLICVIMVVALSLTLWQFLPLLSIQENQQELDFNVSGTNTCLRFFDRDVKIAYVPFKTQANQQWTLTIECQKMPHNGWTDLHIYEGYWNQANNNTCLSQDLYPIIEQIYPVDFRLQENSTFTQTFGGEIAQSYTLFFVFPPGGNGAFHIKLQQV
jgi:hypothetical protein